MSQLLFRLFERVVHVKTGNLYVVVGLPTQHRLEATNQPAYMYMGVDGLNWVRSQEEMEDGRFQVVHPVAGMEQPVRSPNAEMQSALNWCLKNQYFRAGPIGCLELNEVTRQLVQRITFTSKEVVTVAQALHVSRMPEYAILAAQAGHAVADWRGRATSRSEISLVQPD